MLKYLNCRVSLKSLSVRRQQ